MADVYASHAEQESHYKEEIPNEHRRDPIGYLLREGSETSKKKNKDRKDNSNDQIAGT